MVPKREKGPYGFPFSPIDSQEVARHSAFLLLKMTIRVDEAETSGTLGWYQAGFDSQDSDQNLSAAVTRLVL